MDFETIVRVEEARLSSLGVQIRVDDVRRRQGHENVDYFFYLTLIDATGRKKHGTLSIYDLRATPDKPHMMHGRYLIWKKISYGMFLYSGPDVVDAEGNTINPEAHLMARIQDGTFPAHKRMSFII